MHIERITSHLQGAAAIREWTLEHIPHSQSLVAYDLFLRIGSDFCSGQPLDLGRIGQALPYSGDDIRAQARQWIDDGLLVPDADRRDADGAGRVYPTERFLALLDYLVRTVDGVYILRKALRDEQLVVQGAKAADRELVESVYDSFYDLGWLYLHNFGSVCFLMALLAQRVFALHGRRARVESGHVEIDAGGERRFALGSQGCAAPGQIDGHAWCVVDDALIVDLGLGNVRKAYRRTFPWALAAPLHPEGAVAGRMVFQDGQQVRWKTDWRSPSTEAELVKLTPMADQLMTRYLSFFGRGRH